MIMNEKRTQRIANKIHSKNTVALEGTAEAEKDEKILLNKRKKSPRKMNSQDVALRFVRANPADPIKEQIELLAKTIQIESTFEEPSITAGLEQMRNIESRLSNSLIARHHSQFNSMMAFP